MSRIGVVAVAGVIAFGSTVAIAGEYGAYGHKYTYDDFQPRTLDIAVATDRATGHKMNLVRMKNGHMMALVPADRLIGLMADDESLSGGPPGGLLDRN